MKDISNQLQFQMPWIRTSGCGSIKSSCHYQEMLGMISNKCSVVLVPSSQSNVYSAQVN